MRYFVTSLGVLVLSSAVFPQAPANDDCANAAVATLGLTPYDSTMATDGSGLALDPVVCDMGPFGDEQIYQDLWFIFTPSASVPFDLASVSSGNPSFDSRIAIYNQSTCPDDPAIVIACDDDSGSGLEATVFDVALVAGTSYMIRVGSFSSSTVEQLAGLSIFATPPVAGPGVLWEGLPYEALGNAILTVGNTLSVSNIGSSGLDGVRVQLGEAGGFHWMLDPNFLSPAGARQSWTAYGTTDGLPNQPLFYRDVEIMVPAILPLDVGTLRVTHDASPVGAALLEVVAFDVSGQQLHSMVVPNGWIYDMPISTGGVQGSVCTNGGWRPVPGSAGPWICEDGFDPFGDSVLFSDGVSVMNVAVVRTRAVGPVVQTISAMAFVDHTASGIAQFESFGQGPIQNSLPHFALGNATLDLSGGHAGSLQVSNIGSSGLDGVSIDVGQADEFVWTVDLLAPMAVGATFTARYFGTVAGIPDSSLGSSTMLGVAAGAEFSSDFSAFGSTTYKLELFLNDVVVYTEAGKSGPGGRASIFRVRVCWFGTGICSVHFGHTDASEPHDFEVAGGPTVLADLVVMTPEAATFQADFISDCEATASNLPAFVILDELVVPSTGPARFNEVCFGDGGNQMGCTDCPCGNNAPIGSGGGCLNSAATSLRLLPSGSASVSLPSGDTTDLRFGADGAPATAFCILNSGDSLAPSNMANPCFGLNSGVQALAFDGLRCAIRNTRRHGGRSADVNGEVGVTNNPWGGEGGPALGLANAGGGFAAGQTRYFQIINRDDPMAVCGRGLNTSQAVEVTFTP